MAFRNCLYGASGYISRILTENEAEIEFMLEDRLERAYLKKDQFYYNARRVPNDESLTKYIDCGIEVKFSCQALQKSEHHSFGWITSMCWRKDQTPGAGIEILTGIVHVMGSVSKVEEDHGVLVLSDTVGKQHKVHFLASKFYAHGRTLPSSEHLSNKLSIGDKVFCDAVPCTSEKNKDNCNWFATCAFIGKRPNLIEQKLQNTKISMISNPVLQIIKRTVGNAQSMFILGKGLIFEILNDQFGVILGEFQCNNYQQILFHREHAYLFEKCLADLNLSKILTEGDRVKFVAAEAPPNFITDWIAVQVSICDSGQYGPPQFADDQSRVEDDTSDESTES